MGLDSLAQDRDQWRSLVKMVMNLLVQENVGKFLSCCTTGGFSRRAQRRGVFFFNLHSGGWNQGPLDTAAT
jgi:hypothetical protein